MNPPHRRMFPRAVNYEEEPPAYGSYESPPHHNGASMRLLPTTGGEEEDAGYDDVHDGTSIYHYESEYADDDAQSRYAFICILALADIVMVRKLTRLLLADGNSLVDTTSTTG